MHNKRQSFTEEFALRLQNVQIENTDALRIINCRDYEEAFHYIDPPYINTDCGHYDGYSREDFTGLLKCLSQIKGKFILSSFPSIELEEFSQKHNWHNINLHRGVFTDNNRDKARKRKIEVLTANYELKKQNNYG